MRKVSGKIAIVSIVAAILLATAPFWGTPWGWRPSYGASYGDSVKGVVWIKEHALCHGDRIREGDNISYAWNGHFAMKRVWIISSDCGWIWVGGDNSDDGASSGSCEVGWIKLPGTSTASPSWPKPNPKTAPQEPVTANAVVVGFWAPFDRRSPFEKTTRFFSSPRDVVVAGKWLILKGKKLSRAYDRQDGKLVREIPGLVTRFDGKTADFLKPTKFTGDPQQGQINVKTGKMHLSALPQIAVPKPGQIDLRRSQISTTSKVKDPINAFDGDSKTMWGVGQNTDPEDSIMVQFPSPIWVHSISIDSTLAYGTTLTLTIRSRRGERTIQPGQAIDKQIDGFAITLRQHPVHQPLTGVVKEVEVYA